MCVCCHCSPQLTQHGRVLIPQAGDGVYDVTAPNTIIKNTGQVLLILSWASKHV